MKGATLEESVNSLEQIVAKHSAELRKTQRMLASTRVHNVSLFVGRQLIRFLCLIRNFVDNSIVWRPGAVLIGGVAAAGFWLIGFDSLLVGAAGGALGVAFMVLMVVYPPDEKVVKCLAAIDDELMAQAIKISDLKVAKKNQEQLLKSISNDLAVQRLSLAREQDAATHSHRRKALLCERWKEMRSVEFEEFLERVFLELGYSVETTRITGDQGLDLIVSCRGKRIGIQVKGYLNSVPNSAVQQAHAGMAYYGCDASAVITNSRFTQSALELANRLGCQLVDEDLLPNLIMGKVDLWVMCFNDNGR